MPGLVDSAARGKAVVSARRATRDAGHRARRPDLAEWCVHVEAKDEVLYRTARNFLSACDALFWWTARPRSSITKTVGVQALFDVLRLIVPGIIAGGSIRTEVFSDTLTSAAGIDFGDDRFRSASGSGRTAIRAAIIDAIG